MTAFLPDLIPTDRLLLRAPVEADARVLFECYTQDPDLSRYMPWRASTRLRENEDFIAACIADWQGGLSRSYVLAPRENAAVPIGMLELRQGPRGLDVGYWLGRDWWGQGLMPEALRTVAPIALASPVVYRLQAICDVDNRASARTLEKAGFRREGRLERYSVHPNLSPEPRACFMYARCR